MESRKVIRVTSSVVGEMVADKKFTMGRCTTIFKSRGDCRSKELRLACPTFNVPKGPNREFTVDRRRYRNKDRPLVVVSTRRRMRVQYRGRNLNDLVCRVMCI